MVEYESLSDSQVGRLLPSLGQKLGRVVDAFGGHLRMSGQGPQKPGRLTATEVEYAFVAVFHGSTEQPAYRLIVKRAVDRVIGVRQLRDHFAVHGAQPDSVGHPSHLHYPAASDRGFLRTGRFCAVDPPLISRPALKNRALWCGRRALERGV